jgi:hypothetical protein
VVNRIIDKEQEQAIIKLLNDSHQKYIHIPFDAEQYQKIGWDIACLPNHELTDERPQTPIEERGYDRAITAVYRLKNNYVMNNNGARNAALREGKHLAKWTLPWDGNCYVTAKAWDAIRSAVAASSHRKYFVVPMTRMHDNNLLLNKDFGAEFTEEPQILFRMDSREEFNEEYCYGRRSKVELFWRLGIPGKWDGWKDDPWDLRRRPSSEESDNFDEAGWVARLFSGHANLEKSDDESFRQRGRLRWQAILAALQFVDNDVTGNHADAKTMLSIHRSALESECDAYQKGTDPLLSKLVEKLLSEAEAAMSKKPYSVIDKDVTPPSGDKKDYMTCAPYWWPNPETEDGLPYIRKDGHFAPGTELYSADANKYDRTRIQRVFDDSAVLALAWKLSGQKKYANRGAEILRRFFIAPETAMNPNLEYAQVRMGHGGNKGSHTGIIEWKDLYYYLDSVRILSEEGSVTQDDLAAFKCWLNEYLSWLLESDQGKAERSSGNNHGTYYDLQVAAIASFLDDRQLLYETLMRAETRIADQFAEDGSQPEELKRATTKHYCWFNLKGWLNLAQIAAAWNIDFWEYRSSHGANLFKAAEWLLSYVNTEWPYPQETPFENEKFFVLYYELPESLRERIDIHTASVLNKYSLTPRFEKLSDLRVFWNLGLS